MSREVIILGDFNLHFNTNSYLSDKRLTEFSNLLSLTQLITEPTRVTQNAESIIDLIFTSAPGLHTASGVIPITLSDHFLTFTVLNLKSCKKPSCKVTHRNYKHFKEHLFLNDIAFSQAFSLVPYITNVMHAWTIWKSEFIRLCNKHAPITDHKVKQRNNPWVTKTVRNLMQQRDYWHNRARNSRSVGDINNYRYYRNKVNSTIQHVKKCYIKAKLDSNSHNSQKAWKILKQILPPSKTNASASSDITPNELNEFFSSIGTNVTSHFGPTILPNLPVQTNVTFSISPVSHSFIQTFLDKLPNSMTLDPLNMDNRLLKLSSSLIAPQLAHIFNLSISDGDVPLDWKSARITPIYKGKGDHREKGNYRPISIIPTVAKIIESFIKSQLFQFLEHHHLLSPTQFAYISGVSTETALHNIIDSTYKNIDKGKVTAACLLDLTKGFDVVPHDILIF